MSKKKIAEKTEIFYTDTGFGVKSVSRETVKKNLEILRQIAKDAIKKDKEDRIKELTERERLRKKFE